LAFEIPYAIGVQFVDVASAQAIDFQVNQFFGGIKGGRFHGKGFYVSFFATIF
jgi:hypothetical protein